MVSTRIPPANQDSLVKCRTYDGRLLFLDYSGQCYYRDNQGQKKVVLPKLCVCQ